MTTPERDVSEIPESPARKARDPVRLLELYQDKTKWQLCQLIALAMIERDEALSRAERMRDLLRIVREHPASNAADCLHGKQTRAAMIDAALAQEKP
jgi:hypothetical protein